MSLRGAAGHVVRTMAYETVVVLVTAATVAAFAYVALQGRFSDLYLRARGSAALSGEVALVPIDDEALYLWAPGQPAPEVTPRALLAELVSVLDAAGARVIVLDVLLDRPEEGDAALARAAGAHGAVLAAERFVQGSAGSTFSAGPTPALGDAVQGAPANLQAEEGRLLSGELLVRRVPLVTRLSRARLDGPWPGGLVGGMQSEGEITPGLALAAAWLHRARERDPDARLDDLARELDQGCRLRKTGRVGCTVAASNLGLPATPRPLHAPMSLNYRGPEGADGLPQVRAARLLRLAAQQALARQLGADLPLDLPPEVRASLQDRVVLVGRVDEAAASDRFVTPYAFPLLLHADMAGLRIQAQAVDTLLSGRHLRVVGRPWTWLLAGLLAVGILGTRRRLGDGAHGLGWILAMALLVVAGCGLFALTDGLAVQLDLPLAVGSGTLLAVHFAGWARSELGDDEHDSPDGAPAASPDGAPAASPAAPPSPPPTGPSA